MRTLIINRPYLNVLDLYTAKIDLVHYTLKRRILASAKFWRFCVKKEMTEFGASQDPAFPFKKNSRAEFNSSIKTRKNLRSVSE